MLNAFVGGKFDHLLRRPRMLGCLPPRPHQLATLLKLSKYVRLSQLPAPPAATYWGNAVTDWGMLGNAELGDCTEACVGHALVGWAANRKLRLTVPGPGGTKTLVTDPDLQLLPYIVQAYSRVSGYVPGQPSTDRGAVIIDVLNDWRANGVAGNKLGGYVSVAPTDHEMVCVGLYLCGGAACGVNLPLAWQNQTVWDAPSRFHSYGSYAPGSWGGHCVLAIDYDAQFLYVVTWGGIMPVTWAAVDMYFSEFYPLLDWLWTDGPFNAPNGFDQAALRNDLALLSTAA